MTVVFRHVADAGANLDGEVATSNPRTRIVPRVGARNPSSALIIVLLPAPLGPSRPMAPRENVAVTPFSARLRPYSTTTLSRETTGSVSAMDSLIYARAGHSVPRSPARRPARA